MVARVNCVDGFSVADFAATYEGQAPAIFRGATSSWPATRRWNPAYLAERCGDVEVLLRAYRKGGRRFIEQAGEKTRTSSLGDFLATLAPEMENEETYAWSLRESAAILAAVPVLHGDLKFEAVFQSLDLNFETFVWLGPAGYVTGFHTDEVDYNFLAHLYGEKRVTFIAPSDDDKMYAHTDSAIEGGHYSDVDAYAPDLERHPKFGHAVQYIADLVPGDLLYVPKGWWHRVESCSLSISVSGMASR